MPKKRKYISQKNDHKLQEIGRLILRFMNENSTKIYNKVEQEILDNWQKISEKIEKVSTETN